MAGSRRKLFGTRKLTRYTPRMAWIRTIADDKAEGRLARSYEAARKRSGRVANILRAMSLNAATLDASMALYGAIMFGKSPLSRSQREMLATRVSCRNRCFY